MSGEQAKPVEPVEQARLRAPVERAAGVAGDVVQIVEKRDVNCHALCPFARACCTSCGPSGTTCASPDPTPRPLDHLTLLR